MARQIIVINTSKGPGGDLDFDCVFWLATPAAMVQADATRASRASALSANAATAAEVQAIQAGTVTEQSFRSQAPSSATAAQIKAFLQNAYTAAQAALNAQAVSHNYAGSFWDGATWTLT